MATQKCSSLLHSFIGPWRTYASSSARKRPVYVSRESRMGPTPMVHKEQGPIRSFESRDYDISEDISYPLHKTNGCTKQYVNRNPRSNELIGIAEKPKGFRTRKWRVDYYHRLMLEISSRHVSAYVNHNSGKVVVDASTKEFCISKHLYKTSDVCAAYNIGRVLAHRCNEMGLTRMIWEHKKNRYDKKVKVFIEAIHEGGIRLNEPKVKKHLPLSEMLP